MSDTARPDATDRHDAEGIGPAERGVERAPADPTTLRLWALVLAGPVLWLGHFVVVYLFTEAACVALTDDIGPRGDDGWVAALVVAATVVAAGATIVSTVWAHRVAEGSGGDARMLGRAGVLTGVGSVVAIAAVGLPALALGPC